MLARMWKPATALTVSAAQRADLEALVRSGKTPQRVVARALIVLAAAEGTPINAIARGCGMSRPTVYLWRNRFQQPASSACSRMRPALAVGAPCRPTR